MAEAKVLNPLMRRLGLNYGIEADDIYHEFSQFTADELAAMKPEMRWHLLIEIVDHSMKAAGVESIDYKTLIGKVLTGAQMPRAEKASVSKYIEDNPRNKTRPTSPLVSASEYLNIGLKQKESNDPRWMINMTQYHTVVGRGVKSVNLKVQI